MVRTWLTPNPLPREGRGRPPGWMPEGHDVSNGEMVTFSYSALLWAFRQCEGCARGCLTPPPPRRKERREPPQRNAGSGGSRRERGSASRQSQCLYPSSYGARRVRSAERGLALRVGGGSSLAALGRAAELADAAVEVRRLALFGGVAALLAHRG